MKWLIALVLLALIGFYVVWPGLSLYRIYQALEGQDPDALSAKVDFDGVRESLRPAVEKRVMALVAAKLNDDAMVAALGKDVLPKLVDPVLKAVVSPARLVRIYADHKAGISVENSITKIVQEQTSGMKLGGLNLGALAGLAGGGAIGKGGLDLAGIGQALGVDVGMPVAGQPTADEASADGQMVPVADPVSPPAGAKPAAVGLGNLKRLALAGPFAFVVGLARDASSPEADATATMSFQGGDWKLTALRPRD